jgi:hypothetical protein
LEKIFEIQKIEKIVGNIGGIPHDGLSNVEEYRRGYPYTILPENGVGV